MNKKTNGNNGNYDFVNSKALFVLKIITMSFAILAFVVVATAMLTRWIMDLNMQVKESHSKAAKAAARINKFRKERIKHILKQRKLQLKSERAKRKNNRKNSKPANIEDFDEAEEAGCMNGNENDDEDENGINDFDNELSEIMLENICDE